MQHLPDIPRITLGEHMRLAGHFFLMLGLLHEQVARGGFSPNDLELTLAAAHFKPFFGARMSFKLHSRWIVDSC